MKAVNSSRKRRQKATPKAAARNSTPHSSPTAPSKSSADVTHERNLLQADEQSTRHVLEMLRGRPLDVQAFCALWQGYATERYATESKKGHTGTPGKAGK
jgi:hypothetical protein